MNKTVKAFTLALCSAASAFAAGLDEVIAPGTTAKCIASGFAFAEGATANATGELFFTDQPNNVIWRWNDKDGLQPFMRSAGRANGMCFAKDGTLLVCADEKTELWAVSPDKKVKVLAKGFGGKPFNGPNDVWAAPDGGCYLTDPFYKRTWWTYDKPPQASHQVYYLPKDGEPRRVTDDLVQPNGIVGTPDGKTLYVADIDAKKTWAYSVQPDGSLAGKRLFCGMGSDGMTIDEAGHLFLTGKGVHVFNRDGQKLGVIPIPEDWCGNICIGGPGRKTLYVTASKGVYEVPLK
jgi:gluconolactonase